MELLKNPAFQFLQDWSRGSFSNFPSQPSDASNFIKDSAETYHSHCHTVNPHPFPSRFPLYEFLLHCSNHCPGVEIPLNLSRLVQIVKGAGTGFTLQRLFLFFSFLLSFHLPYNFLGHGSSGASILCRDCRREKLVNTVVGGADLRAICSCPPYLVQSNTIDIYWTLFVVCIDLSVFHSSYGWRNIASSPTLYVRSRSSYTLVWRVWIKSFWLFQCPKILAGSRLNHQDEEKKGEKMMRYCCLN